MFEKRPPLIFWHLLSSSASIAMKYGNICSAWSTIPLHQEMCQHSSRTSKQSTLWNFACTCWATMCATIAVSHLLKSFSRLLKAISKRKESYSKHHSLTTPNGSERSAGYFHL